MLAHQYPKARGQGSRVFYSIEGSIIEESFIITIVQETLSYHLTHLETVHLIKDKKFAVAFTHHRSPAFST